MRQPRNRLDEIKDIDHLTPLHYASRNGHTEVVKCFYKHDNDCHLQIVDKRGRTPLHYACWHGHITVVKYFGLKKCDPNTRDEEGKAPLHYARQHKGGQ